MSNYKVEINAINMRDLQLGLKEWCQALGVMPDFDPADILGMIDLDTLVSHVEGRMKEAGFTVNIKSMVDEVAEVKAPKRARKEKTAEPQESVSAVDETDPKDEAVKADVIRLLQALYVKKGGKATVDDIIARYGDGETKLSLIPASVFPTIAQELKDAQESD